MSHHLIQQCRVCSLNDKIMSVQKIYKLASEEVRSLKASGSEAALDRAAHGSRVAAFTAAAALAVTTQKEARHFAILLRAPDGSAAGRHCCSSSTLEQSYCRN